MRRMLLGAVVAVALACGTETAPAGSPQTPAQPSPGGNPGNPVVQPLTLLVLTTTLGFRHTDGINAARQVLPQMSVRTGEFTVEFTENVADITADRLAKTNVLFFALTTGELPFTDAQKSAILSFVNQGGGFMGAHSATDTLYDWADYGRLVGAYFNGHPWTQEVTVNVEGGSHPATRDLGSSLRLFDEYYTFRENPRPRVQVLLSLNTASVGAQGDFPLAWAQSFGEGRAFYTALGHFASVWTDQRFQAHLLGAIRWVGKRE